MPQRGGWRKGRGRLDAPIDHLSADRLADIISTDRVQSTETEPATMSVTEAPQEQLRTDESGPADPFHGSARPGWDQAVDEWAIAEPELGNAEIDEPEVEAPELRMPEHEEPEPDVLPPVWEPPAYVAPPTAPAATRKKSSRKKTTRKKNTAWVGRHRRPKSGKLTLRSLSLTSVLLAMMGVLTLILVATAIF